MKKIFLILQLLFYFKLLYGQQVLTTCPSNHPIYQVETTTDCNGRWGVRCPVNNQQDDFPVFLDGPSTQTDYKHHNSGTPDVCFNIPTVGIYKVVVNGEECTFEIGYEPIKYNDLIGQDFPARDINSNPAIGIIKGSQSVSLTGGATYSIPISLPSGTNGMEPSLSINYNSQGGVGLLGYGWTLGVGSSIGRVAKNLYNDGVVAPVTLESTDAFALDGKRLVLFAGGYGLDNSQYATKEETFSRTTMLGNNGTDGFVVESKNGQKIYYGTTPDSRIVASNGAVLIWQISKIVDNFTNYVEFKYNKANDNYTLAEINYTGNEKAGTPPYHQIKFDYRERLDKNTAYGNGAAISADYLLTGIEILSEQEKFSEYKLSYGNDKIHSYLTEITLTGGGTETLNSTRFKYGRIPDAQIEFQEDAQTINFAYQDEFYTGDFNGDGLTDALGIASTILPNGTKRVQSFQVHLKDATNIFTAKPEVLINNANSLFEYGKNFGVVDNISFMSQDYNSDTYDDVPILKNGDFSVFEPYYDSNGNFLGYQIVNFNAVKEIDIYYSKGDGTFLPETYPVNVFNVHTLDPKYITGDFDGDSNADFMLVLADGTRSSVTINYPITKTLNQLLIAGNGTSNNFAGEFINSQVTSAIDYNGDGKSDIMVQNINSITGLVSFTKVYSIRKEAGNLYLDLLANLNNIGRIASFGDFNTDGKIDILTALTFGNNTNSSPLMTGYSIEYNTGSGFSPPKPVVDRRYGDVLHVSDFDGNGFPDIVFSAIKNIASGTIFKYKYSFYFNGGEESFETKEFLSDEDVANCIGSTTRNSISTIGDFNGDGKADFLLRTCNNNFNLISFQKDATNHLLETVQDGFNREVSFTYDKATTGTVYTKDNTLQRSNEINTVKLPMFLVSTMEQPVSLDLTTNPPTIVTAITDYAYEDALVHRKGLGFLGFSKITEHNGLFNTTNVNINAIQWDNKNKYMSSYLYKSISNSAGVTTETINENEIVNLGNRYWMRPKKTISKNLYTGVTTVQEQVKYDDALDANGDVASTEGNLLELKTTVNTDAEIQVSKTTYGQRGSWIANAPLTTSITTTRKGEDPYTVESTRTFNAMSGELQSETALSNTSLWVKTEFLDYNDFGQATIKKITGAGLPAAANTRTSSMTYSGNGRFVTETANVVGQVEKLQDFDLRWGKPQQITSIGGKIAKAKYDSFGRLIESKSKDLTSGKEHTSTVTYAWATSPYLYTVTSVSPGSPTVKEYFDIFERSVKKEVTGFGGATVTTEVTYDSRGRVSTSKSPHYSGGLFVTTTNTYDDQNRITDIALSGITGSSSMQYVPNASTGEFTLISTDAAGKVTKKVSDATGKTIKTIDDGGELLMTYYSHGGQRTVSLKSVPLYLPPLPAPAPTTALLSTMYYDAAARQSSLEEPNSGTSTYKYNSLGELVEQNIAGGGLTTFTYNLLGQMETSIEPSNTGAVTNTYTYYPTGSGPSTNAIKTVTSTGFSSHQKEYIYDADGRVKDYIETVKGTPFKTSYVYDEFSRVKEYIYPRTAFKIKKVYDGAGYLLKVTDEAGTLNIFEGTAMDALGHYTSYKLGNGIVSTMTYDEYGLPVQFSSSVFDQSYNFNKQNGNLNWRKDNLRNIKEDFTYDVLERLKTATVAGQPVMTMEYADNGNISFKTGLTNYSYDPIKIHAVKRVENYPLDLNRGLQNVSYTKFHQAEKITEKVKLNGINQIETIELEYGTDHERRYAKFSCDRQVTGLPTEVYYLGNYEEKRDLTTGAIYKIHYISGGNGLCAMVVDKGQGFEYFYTYRDYLGSILTVTNATGVKVAGAEQSFDAWGRRRNPTTWGYAGVNTAAMPAWLYRGYTGHEHYDRFTNIQLINMNARLYDPVNARFLRWDIVVADGAGTQGYNRYSYALNNPLKYTDPSGNFLDPITLGLIGAGINVLMNGIQNVQNGQGFFKGAGEAAFKGFIFGVMTAGVGQMAQGMQIAGKATQAFFFKAGMHGLLGGMQSLSGGGSFKSGFASGAVSSMVGGAIMKGTKGNPIATILFGGLSGGVSAEMAGGNFWAGARQGLITAGLNHVANHVADEWQDLDKSTLKEFFRTTAGGQNLSDGQLENAVGHEFESAFIEFMQTNLPLANYQRNNDPYMGTNRNVVPDATNAILSNNVPYPDGGWNEVKAKNGNLYLSSNTDQIAEMFSAYRTQFPRLTNNAHAGVFTIATTSDVKIGASMTNRAWNNGIKLFHVKSQYYIGQSGEMYISFKPANMWGGSIGNNIGVILGRPMRP